MKTKLMQKDNKKKLSAGMLEGLIPFWHEDEKWIIIEGKAIRFTEAPINIQNKISQIFVNDKKSRAYLEQIGISSFPKAMDIWYKCVFCFSVKFHDYQDKKLIPDKHFYTCTDYKCPHRGKFCNLKPRLKNYEKLTINALKNGETIEKTADKLFISVSGLKSRINKIKKKLGATNMASLIAKADAWEI